MRTASITRRTAETDIGLTLSLDGKGAAQCGSGVPFLDHMLTVCCRQAMMDLDLHCQGDTPVDDHHSVEDIGICLGQALRQAVGDKAGLQRYGQWLLPMDEALVLVSLDLSGRAYLGWDVDLPTQKVGTFDTQLAREFFAALCREAGLTLHVRQMSGFNTHHILEAIFKGVGRALRQACQQDPALGGQVNSTKGTL